MPPFCAHSQKYAVAKSIHDFRTFLTTIDIPARLAKKLERAILPIAFQNEYGFAGTVAQSR